MMPAVYGRQRKGQLLATRLVVHVALTGYLLMCAAAALCPAVAWAITRTRPTSSQPCAPSMPPTTPSLVRRAPLYAQNVLPQMYSNVFCMAVN